MKKLILALISVISACTICFAGCNNEGKRTRDNTPIEEPFSITQDGANDDCPDCPDKECPDCEDNDGKEAPLPPPRSRHGHRKPMPKPLPAPIQSE